MKRCLLTLVFIMPLITFGAVDLDYIRTNYFKAVENKSLCKSMIAELQVEKNNSAVYLAYLGGLQTFWANHVFNPLSKLSTFNEGKKNIELAIKKDPNSVEIHFVRLSVQKKAPSFLGYNSSVSVDARFISDHLSQVKSNLLRNNIETLLKD